VTRGETATVETMLLADEPDADEAVWTYDTWFVHGERRQLLATHGVRHERDAPSDSPVSTEIVGNTIRYGFDGQHSSSNWVGLDDAEFTASPLALVREQVDSWNHMVDCTMEHEEWSWRDFNGRVSQQCTRGGACETHESVSIPDVTLPPGYVTFGKRVASDPVVLAVVSGRWLFVQIDGDLDGAREDDRHWVSEDHVEVWTGPRGVFDCAEWSPALQWAVRISDAHVFSGAGNPRTLLRAERASCGPRTVVLRIELPEKRESLTVAYSGGEAHKQRLLMATSQLVYGDGASLGSVKKIDPKRATCVVKGDRLEPRMTVVASNAAMASFE
jgi:hypothetical protein